MLTSRLAVSAPAARSLLTSLRVEMFVTLMAAVVIPALVLGRDVLPSAGQRLDWAVIAAFAGTFLGVMMLRRVTSFPGTQIFGFILPAFATTFGGALAMLLLGRFDYSRLYLTISFVAAIAVAFAIRFYLARVSAPRFYLVPFGAIDVVRETPQVEWVALTQPQLPADRNAVIVADLRYDHPDEWERLIAEAAVRGHTVYHIKQVGESLTGKVSIEHLSENSFGSLLPNRAYLKVKRGIDLTAALLLLPLLALPMLFVALLIRLDSPGPALFRQQRMGYRGEPFTVIKFRTMRERAQCNGEGGLDAAVTLDDDARITRLGRFLRRTRIDELPQIINIILGEMSWIGPRPEAIALSQWYERELPFYRYRHIVRPGISGWAQVNQGHVADLESVHHKLHYDFFYIKHFSAWLDVLIALRTILTVISGFGAK